MLKDKVAIITGGAQGIGRACAERFAAEGAHVAVADIKHGGWTAGLGKQGLDIHFYRCDVGDKQAVDDFVNAVVQQFGRVDILVNNAALLRVSPFLEQTEADFDAVIRASLKSVFLCGQAVARVMVDRKIAGSIINMSSINAVVAIPTHAAYSAAKGGIAQLTKVMAVSLAAHGIRVNAIGPGTIATEMAKTNTMSNEEGRRRMLSRTPLKRPGNPEEIAAIAVFLATAESSYITGQTIYADGGRLALNQTLPVD